MSNDWNKEGYFSGITEDYSNYKWYKGENSNPYLNDRERSLAASFWEYEQQFHFSYLDARDTAKTLDRAYQEWKESLIKDYLPGKSPNPYGDSTDWAKAFETGKKGE